jgi:NMD protein affecting ribosome stability and mRNA decay
MANIMGVHHLNFLKDQKTIYVGSDEGTLFIIDYTSTPMRIVKTVQAGKGAGHTDEMKHNQIAVVINHKDKFITLMNTQNHTKIADIEVSSLNEVGTVQTHSHPQYHFSKDGRYFYLFLTEEGALVKVDLIDKKVVERLEIGGKLAMGSFVES